MDSAERFRDQVNELVAQIPAGRVMSYGQIAALCGSPRASRIVGQIARFGSSDLPWHRVVYQDGRLAGAFPGGRTQQAALLVADGVAVNPDYKVNMSEFIWRRV